MTRISASVSRDSAASRRARSGRSPRSKPTLLSPQTTRSTSWPASCRVSRSSRSKRRSALSAPAMTPGWTSAIRVRSPVGSGRGAPAHAADPAAAGGGHRDQPRHGRHPHPAHRDQHGHRDVQRHHQEARQPHPAHGRQPQRGLHLPLARAQHAPRPAEPLPGADQLDRQPARRHHEQRGGDPAPGRRAAQRPAHQPPPRRPQRAQQRGDDEREHVQAGQQPVVHGQHEGEAAAPAVERGPPSGRRGADQQQPGDQGDVGDEPQVRGGERQDGQRARDRGGGRAAPRGGEEVADVVHGRLPTPCCLQCASRTRPDAPRDDFQSITSSARPPVGLRHLSSTTTRLSRQPSGVRTVVNRHRPPLSRSSPPAPSASPPRDAGLT